MKNSIAFILLILSSSAALAAGGAHGDDHGIPWMMIAAQAFNFALLLGLLGYIGRKAISSHFSERRRVYLELVDKADAAKREAEKNRKDIAQRLSQLEQTSQKAIDDAKAEAAQLQKKIVSDAEEMAKRLQADSQQAAQIELEKAKQALRAELLGLAVDAAHKVLKDKVGGAEQKQLQSEFASKIQVVQS